MLHLLLLVVIFRAGASQGGTSVNIDTVTQGKIGNEYAIREEVETLNINENNVEHKSDKGLDDINIVNVELGNNSEV